MRLARLSLLLVAATLATPASAQSFLGKWIATADSPNGPVSEEITVSRTEQGYTIATRQIGDVAPGMEREGTGTDIVLEGDSFSYKRTVPFQGDRIVLVYTGTVRGDTFTGQAEVGGFTIPYTGDRQELGEPTR